MSVPILERLMTKTYGILVDDHIFTKKEKPVMLAIGASKDLTGTAAETLMATAIVGWTRVNYTILAGYKFVPMKVLAVRPKWTTAVGCTIAIKNTTPGTDEELAHLALGTNEQMAVIEYPIQDEDSELLALDKLELFATPGSNVAEARLIEVFVFGMSIKT